MSATTGNTSATEGNSDDDLFKDDEESKVRIEYENQKKSQPTPPPFFSRPLFIAFLSVSAFFQ